MVEDYIFSQMEIVMTDSGLMINVLAMEFILTWMGIYMKDTLLMDSVMVKEHSVIK